MEKILCSVLTDAQMEIIQTMVLALNVQLFAVIVVHPLCAHLANKEPF